MRTMPRSPDNRDEWGLFFLCANLLIWRMLYAFLACSRGYSFVKIASPKVPFFQVLAQTGYSSSPKLFLPMKKHLVFSVFFAFAAVITVEAQSITHSGAQSPTDAAQKVRQAAEQSLSAFNSRDNGNDRGNCDCDKCQKHKKSKKNKDCKQNGKHYGKHKNKHGRASCSCDHHCGDNRKKRNCGDDDDRRGRNGRDRDDDDRRGGWGSRDRDNDNRGEQTRTGQRTPPVKVKSTPTSRQPGSKRNGTPRPVSTRN